MFRSDRDALASELSELRREREELLTQNEAMRADLLERARQVPPLPDGSSTYKRSVDRLSPGERAALMCHDVEAFPLWAVLVLHFLTFGLFSLVHFSRLHGRLPRAERDDPSPARAIGFSFIPYFNLYWIVFNTLRLTDRLNLQLRLRGLPGEVPRNLMTVAAVSGVVPYLNVLLGFPILWPLAVFYLQRAANTLAESRESEASAVTFARVDAPRLRVPLVRDLPGPDDVVAAEAEAAETGWPRKAVR